MQWLGSELCDLLNQVGRSRMHDLSAVDVQGLSGDVSGVGGGEVGGHCADFLGSLPLCNGDEFAEFFAAPCFKILSFRFRKKGLSCFPHLLLEARLNPTRHAGVYSDSVGSADFCRAVGETDEARFCCGVGRVCLRTDLSGHGY